MHCCDALVWGAQWGAISLHATPRAQQCWLLLAAYVLTTNLHTNYFGSRDPCIARRVSCGARTSLHSSSVTQFSGRVCFSAAPRTIQNRDCVSVVRQHKFSRFCSTATASKLLTTDVRWSHQFLGKYVVFVLSARAQRAGSIPPVANGTGPLSFWNRINLYIFTMFSRV